MEAGKMKALFIALLASFVVGLILIYHDAHRSQNAERLSQGGDLQIIICESNTAHIVE